MFVDFGNMSGCSPKGAAVRSLPSPFWDDPTWPWSFVARHQWDLVAIFSGCRVYSQLLTDQTWHPTFFSQIWARFCSFSVGARFDPENDDPPTRLKRGYTMLHISSSGAPRVVESGFAGPIIVLVRMFEGNFSTKPWFSRISMGFLSFLKPSSKLLTIQEIDIDVENP